MKKLNFKNCFFFRDFQEIFSKKIAQTFNFENQKVIKKIVKNKKNMHFCMIFHLKKEFCKKSKNWKSYILKTALFLVKFKEKFLEYFFFKKSLSSNFEDQNIVKKVSKNKKNMCFCMIFHLKKEFCKKSKNWKS